MCDSRGLSRCKAREARITKFVLPNSLLVSAAVKTHESGRIPRHKFTEAFCALLANYVRERCVSSLAETPRLRIIKTFGREHEHPRFRHTLHGCVR